MPSDHDRSWTAYRAFISSFAPSSRSFLAHFMKKWRLRILNNILSSSRQKLDGIQSFHQLFRPFILLISLKNGACAFKQCTAHWNNVLSSSLSRQKLDGIQSFHQLFRPFISLITLKNGACAFKQCVRHYVTMPLYNQLSSVCYDLHHLPQIDWCWEHHMNNTNIQNFKYHNNSAVYRPREHIYCGWLQCPPRRNSGN